MLKPVNKTEAICFKDAFITPVLCIDKPRVYNSLLSIYYF